MSEKIYISAKDRDEFRLKEKRLKKSKRKKERRKRTVPRTVQQTMPYKRVCDEFIFKLDDSKYSKTYVFEDVNYTIADQEEQKIRLLYRIKTKDNSVTTLYRVDTELYEDFDVYEFIIDILVQIISKLKQSISYSAFIGKEVA